MAGQLTIDTLKASTGVLATQNGMTGIAKAWVNFNGVTTATIRSSFNVSSITRNAAGNYTVNFTTAFSDANYCVSGCLSPIYGVAGTYVYANCSDGAITEVAPTTTAFRFTSGYSAGYNDVKYAYIAVFSA